VDKKAIIDEINFLVNKLKDAPLSSTEMDKISQFEVEMLLKISEKLYLQLTILDYLVSSKSATIEKEKAVNKFKAVFEEEVTEKQAEPVKSVNLFGEDVSKSIDKPKQEKKTVEKEVTKQSSIQNPKIDNLNNAIGLNDRFQFANELFAGNMHEYDAAIHQLNVCESLESAMHYALNLQQLYNWDMENETVKRLLELIDRRYPS